MYKIIEENMKVLNLEENIQNINMKNKSNYNKINIEIVTTIKQYSKIQKKYETWYMVLQKKTYIKERKHTFLCIL